MASTINASNSGSGGIVQTADASGVLQLQSAGTTAVTIDTSQNVGIGTTSPSYKLDVQGTTANQRISSTTGTNAAYQIFSNTGQNLYVGLDNSAGNQILSAAYGATFLGTGAYPMVFGTNNSERMRIDSSGRVLIGATAPISTEILYAVANTTDLGFRFYNSNSNPSGLMIKYPSAAPNGTGNNFLLGVDSGPVTRFYFSSNGGLNNFSANNTNLSDQREKKDIQLAPNYLNKICQIPVKTFLYNDQTDQETNLGVIAQDVQSIAPELVSESDWSAEKDGSKIRLSVYQTDLQYALLKSIQELKAINDQQAETINAQSEAIASLTARVVALEGK